jgi:hypothetical protein
MSFDAIGGNRPYQTYSRGNQRVAAVQQPDRTSNARPAAIAQQPQFSVGEWCLNFLKGGVVDTVKSICSPQGLLMLGVGAALYLNPVTGPFMLAATPFLIGAGVAMGGTKMVTNGVGSLIKAAEGDVEGSYMDAQAAGQGAATMGLSLVGARSFYRGGGTVMVNGKQASAVIPNPNMGTREAVRTLFLDMRGRLPRYYHDGSGAVMNASYQDMSLMQIARQNLGQAWGRTNTANAGTASASAQAVSSNQTTALIPYQPQTGSAAQIPVNPAPAAVGNGWVDSARTFVSSLPGRGRQAIDWARQAPNFVSSLPGRGRQVVDWARQNPNDAITRGGAFGSQLQQGPPSPLDGQPGHYLVG